MEERDSLQTRIRPNLASFIEAQTSIFLATANAECQPYIRIAAAHPAFSRWSTIRPSASPISPDCLEWSAQRKTGSVDQSLI
jgi:hypothetical protein